jgi:integrase
MSNVKGNGHDSAQSRLEYEGRRLVFHSAKNLAFASHDPLPQSMAVALAEHKRRQSQERLKLGSEWQDHGLVFTTTLGSPLNISNLTSKHFKPALQRAGLPTTIRLYDLRHTCATLLLGAGENPKVVSERLGHASIVLTLDVYSHVLPDMQKAATDKLENLLFRRTGTL